MIKLFILILIIISVAIACNKKTVPVITERHVEQPKKIASVYPPNSPILPDTVVGKEVFITRCGRCHDLPKPEQFTFDRWDDILTKMVPRSKLTAEQSAHITAFIKANAAK